MGPAISGAVVAAAVVLLVLVVVLALVMALPPRDARRATGGAPQRAAPRVHIVVPFRAGPDQPERADQLDKFLARFSEWAAEDGHDIHVVEQGDDHPFNRGALLNAGFDLVCGGGGGDGDDVFVFHDVDLLPDAALLASYGDPPPVHLAAGWDRYSAKTYLGGALSLTGRQFREIGGFPNDFWGWGGEDDELRERLRAAGLFGRVRRPRAGALTDLEGLDLAEKLAVLKRKGLKCPFKIERRDAHKADRAAGLPPRGLARARDVFVPAGDTERGPGVTVRRVCLRELPPTRVVWAEELAGPGPRGPGPAPHADEFQARLEGQIGLDLAKYAAAPGVYDKMRRHAADDVKYLRSCVFVECAEAPGGGAATVRCEAPDPDSPAWKEHMPDLRTATFSFMVRELVRWCARHGLAFPRGRFAIYVTDTYAWEEGAKDLPWMVVARPANRGGVLVPDNSFVTHGESNSTKTMADGMSWAWDDLVARARRLAPPARRDRSLFFLGANTGNDKYAVRQLLAKHRGWAVPADIRLFGPHNRRRESVLSWNRHGVLLNLPGHQPWSYRLKYLFLTKRPVINVDVEVDYGRGEVTGRWVQFYDRIFRPNVDFVRLALRDRDRATGHERRAAAKTLATAIEGAYQALAAERADAIAASAFAKAAELSASRMLQYMYRLFGAFSAKFP